METEKITIKLSDKQRRLLMDKVTIPDDNLKRSVSLALKRDDHYEIILSFTNLEALCEAIVMQTPQSKELQDQLDELHDFFDDIFWEVGEDLLRDAVNKADDFVPETDTNINEFEDDDDEDISQPTVSVYIFKVMLTEDIWRRIAIRGGQTLDDLHEAIFKAFNRFDTHLYSFYFPPPDSRTSQNLWSMVKKSTEYTHPYHLEESFGQERQRYNAQKTTIESLPLNPRRVFWYLFDFGDEWWHKIVTQKCDEKPPSGRYPRILEKKGKSPPQYDY